MGLNMSKDMQGQDLTEHNFYETDLRGANLEGATLTKISVSEISFEGANLTAANISGANIIETDFTNANLTNANVSGTGFTFCNFINTTLKNADLTKMSVHDGTFDDVDMQDALLDHGIITTSFNRVNLDSASLQNTNLRLQANVLSLQLAQLNNAAMYNSSFTDVNGQGAELERISISNSTFERCDFTNADFQRAIVGDTTFTDCSFNNGSLQELVISRSHFIRCDFTNCDLRFVGLDDCTLKDCIFTGAKYNSRTYWPDDFDIETQGAIREMTEMEKNIAAIQAHMDSPHLSEDTSQMLREQYEQTGTITPPDSAKKDRDTWTNKDDIFGSNKSTNKPDYDQTKTIEQFIQDGLKIQAIKLWRECTGNSLKDAKDIIEHFEKHGVWISVDDLPKSSSPPSESYKPTPVNTTSIDLNIEDTCAALIAEGKKVQAIKKWREGTGDSLKDAKTTIERFERTGSWSAPVTTSPPAPKNSTETTPDSEEMEDEHTPAVERQGFGLGYWLVVLGLVIYLGMRVLS